MTMTDDELREWRDGMIPFARISPNAMPWVEIINELLLAREQLWYCLDEAACAARCEEIKAKAKAKREAQRPARAAKKAAQQ